MAALDHALVNPAREVRGFDAKWLIIASAVLIVAWLALVPLVFLLWQSFLTPQTAAQPSVFTLENFRTAYFSSETWRLFFNSVQYATGTALLALGLGTTLTTRHLLYEKEAEAALGLPPGVHSYAILPVGWPMGKFGPVGRGPLNEIVYQDRWGQPYAGV